MRKFLLMSGLLGLMIIVGAPTQAQQFDPAMFKLVGPVMRIVNGNPTIWLSNKSVQTELKLTEEQTKSVNEKFASLGGGFGFGKGGFGKGGKDGKGNTEALERMAKMMEKVKDLKDVPEDKLEEKIKEIFKDEIEQPMKDAEKILKPEQLTRLKQIGLQRAGVNGYVTEAKTLKLTDEQVKKIKDINTELEKDLRELRGTGGKGGFTPPSPETREKMTKLTNEAKESIDALLKDDQKKAWKELTGEPFEIKFDFTRPTPKKKDD